MTRADITPNHFTATGITYYVRYAPRAGRLKMSAISLFNGRTEWSVANHECIILNGFRTASQVNDTVQFVAIAIVSKR